MSHYLCLTTYFHYLLPTIGAVCLGNCDSLSSSSCYLSRVYIEPLDLHPQSSRSFNSHTAKLTDLDLRNGLLSCLKDTTLMHLHSLFLITDPLRPGFRSSATGSRPSWCSPNPPARRQFFRRGDLLPALGRKDHSPRVQIALGRAMPAPDGLR